MQPRSSRFTSSCGSIPGSTAGISTYLTVLPNNVRPAHQSVFADGRTEIVPQSPRPAQPKMSVSLTGAACAHPSLELVLVPAATETKPRATEQADEHTEQTPEQGVRATDQSHRQQRPSTKSTSRAFSRRTHACARPIRFGELTTPMRSNASLRRTSHAAPMRCSELSEVESSGVRLVLSPRGPADHDRIRVSSAPWPGVRNWKV